MTTLTERYISAVVRGVPAKQRDDLRAELTASVGDAIDDRVEAGASPQDAEYATIAELGDPGALAASYADRRPQLIGPELYPVWKTLVILLEAITLPIVAIVILIVWFARGESLGEAVGASAWITFETGVHILFWTTLALAIYERVAPANKPLVEWTPELLPDPSPDVDRRGALIGIAWTAISLTPFALSWFVSPYTDADGSPITFFDPWLVASGVVWVLFAVLLFHVVALLVQARGGRSRPLAMTAIAVDVVGGAAVILAGATGHVLNPAFGAAAGWSDTPYPIVNVTIVCVGALAILVSLWENIRTLRRRR